MLHVRICSPDGAVIEEGTCSDSGHFPVALASVYNAALNLVPARNVEHLDGIAPSADYPVGTSRATFGYSLSARGGSGRVLDDEVVVHVERTLGHAFTRPGGEHGQVSKPTEKRRDAWSSARVRSAASAPDRRPGSRPYTQASEGRGASSRRHTGATNMPRQLFRSGAVSGWRHRTWRGW